VHENGEPVERLELDGVTLRRSDAGDAEAVADAVAANLERLAAWMPWATPAAATPEHAHERVSRMREEWAAGTTYEYLAVDPVTDVPVGFFGLHRRIGEGGIEIGYWLTAEAEGHGLASAAVRALTDVALGLRGVRRVEIHCDEANLRSQAVPRRLGYRLDRVEAQQVETPRGTDRQMIWIYPPGAGDRP
jgi:RimJ/RimL family protein N-acetyltransferase